MPELEALPQRLTKHLEAPEPSDVHVDLRYLPQMPDGNERRYVFVAIDRATCWASIAINHHCTAAAARRFRDVLIKAAAFTILMDNGTDPMTGCSALAPSTPAA